MKIKSELMVNGILLVDKPKDWTSHDVCDFVRKRFRIRKVGHAGTLDPLATGLLVVLLGHATKQSMKLTACEKEYEGIMQLGVQTDSHDRLGKILKEAPVPAFTIEELRRKTAPFTGDIVQVPPMVSALKHKGVRLYKLARQGQEVHRDGRNVRVDSFDIKKADGPLVSFFVRVSKGTYVRTLVNDYGESLGCLATLYELRRLRSGTFDLAPAVTIDELRQMKPEELTLKVLPLNSFEPYAYTE